jgi:hypothetical protein
MLYSLGDGIIIFYGDYFSGAERKGRAGDKRTSVPCVSLARPLVVPGSSPGLYRRKRSIFKNLKERVLKNLKEHKKEVLLR